MPNYVPDHKGMREMVNESWVADLVKEAAEVGKAFAEADDPGATYSVSAVHAAVGYNAEVRPAAELSEIESDKGADRKTLVRSVDVMEAD